MVAVAVARKLKLISMMEHELASKLTTAPLKYVLKTLLDGWSLVTTIDWGYCSAESLSRTESIDMAVSTLQAEDWDERRKAVSLSRCRRLDHL